VKPKGMTGSKQLTTPAEQFVEQFRVAAEHSNAEESDCI
jgi:hypothetical protein